MQHTLFIKHEDYQSLKSFLVLLGKLIYSIDQSKQEEDLLSRFEEIKNDEAEIKRNSAELAEELRQSTDKNGGEAYATPSFVKDKTGFLKFTEKEILKLPTKFRKTFRANGCIAHVRRRKRGKFGYDYEARYRRDGYNISVSSKDYDKLIPKFTEAITLWEEEHAGGADAPTGKFCVPTTFAEFAEHYLETFWRRTVDTRTFKTEMNRYRNHIKPFFGSVPIKRITPAACQSLLDKITEEGLGKTADEVHTRLNMIFEAAIDHSIIAKNPLKLVVHIEHERKEGVALTYEEERYLLNVTAGTPWQLMFAVALYTGLRPNEYKTAHIEGEFIISAKSKQRGRKRGGLKKIPITPMLRPYLNGAISLRFYVPQRIREKLRALLPGHTLKDLRKTFNTRCVECNVDYIARKLFMGHSLGKLDDTYTQPSDEYLIREGNKLNYDLPPTLPPNTD